MKTKSLTRLFAAGVLIQFAACGPKVTLSPDLKSKPPAALALLPITGLEDARPARVKYLQQSLQSELKNRGYSLIDDAVVRRACRDAQCTDRAAIINRYPQIAGFVSLDVSSFSRNNFGLGYYNTVAGTLTVSDVNGKQLGQVEARESERGGLVFESGQVFQGLINQFRNYGDEKFNRLADKFTHTIISKLPAPTIDGSSADLPTAIEQVELKSLKADVYQVCAIGSPGANSGVIVGGLRTNLRETKPGKYCGIMRVDDTARVGGKLVVELRSPFGSSARRDITLSSADMCDLAGRVKAARSKDAVTISILCSAPNKSAAGKTLALQCADSESRCEVSKFLVYRAPSEQGPYEKIRELKGTSWTDRIKPNQSNVVYTVVSVDTNGILSRPISVTPTN